MKRSKRYQKRATLVEEGKIYSLTEAVKILKMVEKTKADETISLSFQLGVRAEPVSYTHLTLPTNREV